MRHLFLCLCAVLIAPIVAIGYQQEDAELVAAMSDVSVSGVATLVKAANISRIALSCTNTSSSVAVRWGGSDVTSTKGQRIAPGTAIEIRTHAAVYMISEGASVTVSCTEELQ